MTQVVVPNIASNASPGTAETGSVGTAKATLSRTNLNATIATPRSVRNRMPGLPNYSLTRSVTRSVIGKAITPAVITTRSKGVPKSVTVPGKSISAKSLSAVASAITSAVRKTAAQMTWSFCERVGD